MPCALIVPPGRPAACRPAEIHRSAGTRRPGCCHPEFLRPLAPARPGGSPLRPHPDRVDRQVAVDPVEAHAGGGRAQGLQGVWCPSCEQVAVPRRVSRSAAEQTKASARQGSLKASAQSDAMRLYSSQAPWRSRPTLAPMTRHRGSNLKSACVTGSRPPNAMRCNCTKSTRTRTLR